MYISDKLTGSSGPSNRLMRVHVFWASVQQARNPPSSDLYYPCEPRTHCRCQIASHLTVVHALLSSAWRCSSPAGFRVDTRSRLPRQSRWR